MSSKIEKKKAENFYSLYISIFDRHLFLLNEVFVHFLSILQSLDSDMHRNSDQMVKVLTIMLQGHSFDVLRLAAAGAGHLQDFMSKLIRYVKNLSVFSDVFFFLILDLQPSLHLSCFVMLVYDKVG